MLRDVLLETVLKVSLATGFVSLVLWVAVYTKLTNLAAWRHPLGLTFIIKSLLLAALFAVVGMSTFVNLGPRTSEIVGWVDVLLIGSVTPVMVWRTAVFIRFDRAGKMRVLSDALTSLDEPREAQEGPSPG
jgi:hypothetical protein